MVYAQRTTVPVEQSRSDIEQLVKKNGATQFAYYDDERKAVIQFVSSGRMLRFTLPLPEDSRNRDQEIRSRWRSLLLAIKAKYETVRSGISEFETEFLPHIVVGANQTVADIVRPKIAELYKNGRPTGVLNLEFQGK